MEHNTVSECVRAVAATYGCKILQLYKYEDTPRIPVFARYKTEDYQVEVFLHCLDSTRSKIKLIPVNIPFYEDRTIGHSPCTYLVAGYM